MSKIDHSNLTATPEEEDFAHKYTEEGQGKIGRRLLDNYFQAVEQLANLSGGSKKRSTAIEIGCGEGFSTVRLRQLLPDTVELQASEYVKEMVPRARERNPGIKVFQESVYETKHRDNSFDLVFLLEVLEHLDYPETALTELKRILKPSGYLVLGVPREPLWCTLNMARGKYLRHWGNTPGHLNHWSTWTIKRFAGRHFYMVESRTPLPWTLLLLQKQP